MLKIGITGRIGSGKSTICHVFESLGIPVYYSDIEAKKFYDNAELIKNLSLIFGKGILDVNNYIDKRALACIVFNDEDKLNTLNNIIHPLVIKDFENWYKNKSDFPYILFESAIIYECGLTNLFSKIIYVDCPEDISIKRVMKRDNATHQAVLDRLSKQNSEIPDYDFKIVSNEIDLETPQVIEIHKQLLELSHQK